MSVLVPFRAEHLARIELQPEQAFVADLAGEGYGAALEGGAWSVLVDGRPVLCAGIADMDGVATAWAVLSWDARLALVTAFRWIDAFLTAWKGGQIFTLVREGFAQGERFARKLGFIPCDAAPVMGPDGRAYRGWTYG